MRWGALDSLKKFPGAHLMQAFLTKVQDKPLTRDNAFWTMQDFLTEKDASRPLTVAKSAQNKKWPKMARKIFWREKRNPNQFSGKGESAFLDTERKNMVHETMALEMSETFS